MPRLISAGGVSALEPEKHVFHGKKYAAEYKRHGEQPRAQGLQTHEAETGPEFPR